MKRLWKKCCEYFDRDGAIIIVVALFAITLLAISVVFAGVNNGWSLRGDIVVGILVWLFVASILSFLLLMCLGVPAKGIIKTIESKSK